MWRGAVYTGIAILVFFIGASLVQSVLFFVM
jgi:hypothetical protein